MTDVRRLAWIGGSAFGAIVGVTQRGFIYGLIPGAAIGLLCGLLSMRAGRVLSLRTRAGSVLQLVSVIALTGLFSWWLLKPPDSTQILRQYIAADVEPVDRGYVFHDWSRDPTYLLRFSISVDALERLLAAVHAKEEIPPRSAKRDLASHAHISLPEWWDICGRRDVRTWSGKSPAGPLVRVRYDTIAEIVFLEFLFQ